MTWTCPSCGTCWPENPFIDGTVGCPECGSAAGSAFRPGAEMRESVPPAGIEPATTPESNRALYPLSYGGTRPSPRTLRPRADGIRNRKGPANALFPKGLQNQGFCHPPRGPILRLPESTGLSYGELAFPVQREERPPGRSSLASNTRPAAVPERAE